MTDRLNLIDTIAKQDTFSTFARLMASSSANDIFSGPGEFTVFAPTNDAFAKVPEAKMLELLNETNQTTLKSLLSYHVMPAKVMAASIGSTPTRAAFTGEELTFSDLNGLKVNTSSIQARNIEATNGVVHAVDTVLKQPTTTATLAAAVAASTGTPVANPAAPASIPIVADSSVASAVPTSPAAAEARADIKSIL
jgi:uncharacterized surface protein with fasciclin (FAS1) repeats